jgi:HEAT repeat protein
METIAKREFRAGRAFSAFEILGEVAAPAIPDLVRVANQGNSGSSPAATAALGHLGKDALPPLLALSTNSAFPFRNEAMMSVGRMHYLGTNAHPAVVLLIQSLSDPHLAPSAAKVLGSLRLESDITVPALAECTHSSQQLLRMYAATSLAKFGASARPVAPELLKMLDDPSVSVRAAVTNALLKIAPEALPKTEPQ